MDRRRLILAGASRWTPAILFAGGGAGFWFLPQPIARFFQLSTGATPVASDSDPIGFALDVSKTTVEGAEQVSNGDFESGDGWTLATGFSISAGKLHVGALAGAATDASRTPNATLMTGIYKSVYTVSNYISGFFRAVVGGFNVAGLSAAGTFTQYTDITSVSVQSVAIRNNTAATGSFDVDDFSVKYVAAASGIQATVGARPKWHSNYLEFDGVDDNLLTTVKPTTSMTIICVGTMAAVSDVMIGSRPAADGFAYMGTDASGNLCGAVGTEGFSTIAGSADIRGVRGLFALRWNGSTVTLNRGNVVEYTGAQSGAVNTTIPFRLGSLNDNGTSASAAELNAEAFIVVNRMLTDFEISRLVRYFQV